MVEFPPLPEQLNEETLINRVKEIDALIPSPEQRAARVFKVLQESAEPFDVWDITCFAAEFLGMQVTNLPFIEDEIKKIAGLINFVHYRQPEIISGGSGINSNS